MAKHNIGAILSLKDNMSATLKGVRKEQSEFRKDVENTRKHLERTYKKKYNLKLEHTAAMQKIKETRKRLEPLRHKVITVLAHKDMITRNVRKTHNQLKTFAKKTFAPVVTIKDKTVGFFNGFKKRVFNLKSLALGAFAGLGIKDFLMTAGRTETLNIAMESVAKSTGNAIDEVKKYKEEVMNQGIAEQEATQVMTRFMQSNLDIAKASEIARVAQDAAVVAGVNSSDATETMVEAVAKLRPELLTSFGMTKGLNDIYNDHAERLGIVAYSTNKYGKQTRHLRRELTETEKKQAMMNYILEEGEKLTGTYESSMGSAFKKLGSLERYWTTFKEQVAAPLMLPAFGVAIDGITNALKGSIEWTEKNKETLVGWGEKASSVFTTVAEWVSAAMPVVKDVVGNTMDWLSQSFSFLGGHMKWLRDTAVDVWPGIQDAIKTAWKVISPILRFLINANYMIVNVFKLAFPTIKTVVSSAWSVVAPILEKLGDALGWVADKAGKIADWLDKKVEARSGTGEVKKVHGSHATGLARVPFDGYIAKLHRDEAVLPAHMNPFKQNTRNITTTNTTTTKNENRPSIVINVNAKDMSPQEIVNEIIPPLKLALANM